MSKYLHKHCTYRRTQIHYACTLHTVYCVQYTAPVLTHTQTHNMHSTVTVHYAILFYSALYYIIPHCTTLDYTAPQNTTLRCNRLQYIKLHYTTLLYSSLHYTVLHYTALHCTQPHNSIQHLARTLTHSTSPNPMPYSIRLPTSRPTPQHIKSHHITSHHITSHHIT